MDEKREAVLAAEKIARCYDNRILNVHSSWYVEIEFTAIVANSYGLLKNQSNEYCYFYMHLIASDGNETQTGFDVDFALSPRKINYRNVAETAAQRALEKLGAREIESGEFAVVFDPNSASELLSAFVASPMSPFYGVNIQKGRSRLAGKLGNTIGSDLFTIVDDPQKGLSPVYFDGDGVNTKKFTLVEKGVFQNVVHNLYSAAREEGASTTGHGSRGKSGVGVSLHNPALEPGSGTLDDLLATLGHGLLVTEVEGLYSGIDPISGDFSVPVKGFMVDGGKKTFPVRNIVAAGNFFELAKNLRAKANDAREFVPEPLNSPSILIEKLSISGR